MCALTKIPMLVKNSIHSISIQIPHCKNKAICIIYEEFDAKTDIDFLPIWDNVISN